MSIENPDPPPSLLRRLLPLVGLVLAAAAIIDGVIFYSRWSSARELEHTQAVKEASDARAFLKIAGGNEVKILAFYASPRKIHPGQKASLCYGVNKAKTVRLDPPVEEMWPALMRCIEVSPAKDTEYKLTAEDAAGHSVSQSAVIQVEQ